MIAFMGMLFTTLMGITLSIFGVITAIVGTIWLLRPLIIFVLIFVVIGYIFGRKRSRRIEGSEESKKTEDEE